MNTREQGAIGVAKAIEYYASQGIPVFIPLADTRRYDLVIERKGLKRVEVKTTSSPGGEFMLRTCGGNRSWNTKPKFLSAKDCDLVFLYDIRNEVFKEFRIKELEGRRTIQSKTFRGMVK